MDATIRKVIREQEIEVLRDHLRSFTGETVIYLEVIGDGIAFADYLIEISPKDSISYNYMLGGHGIGSNHRHPCDLDSTITRVIKDNATFNRGGAFTFEYSE